MLFSPIKSHVLSCLFALALVGAASGCSTDPDPEFEPDTGIDDDASSGDTDGSTGSDTGDRDAGDRDAGDRDAGDRDAGDAADTGDDGDPADTTDGDTGDADGGDEPIEDDDETHPFPAECVDAAGDTVTFDYEVSDSADSYMIVPYSPDREAIDTYSITTPSGEVIDFYGDNEFQWYGLQYPVTQWLNPMVFPPAPNYTDQFETGVHTFELAGDADEICYYVIENSDTSTTLDLNVYLVGLDGIGLTSQTADDHDDFQAVLDDVDDILQQAAISLDQIRYLDVPQEAVDNYRIIGDLEEAYDLIGYSQYPGDDIDSSLSINLFVTEQFTDGSLGVAMGIPGVAGMHETRVAGVATTGEYIGEDADHNLFTANVIAHEIGHYLGLFHTSEIDGQHFDNLDDTPECPNINQSWNCPDRHNVMFPFVDFDTVELTDDQSYVLRVNPLTR